MLREINGDRPRPGEPLTAYTELQRRRHAPSCGCWIYTGVYADGVNQAAPAQARQRAETGSPPEWGWAWPANRRILYNRASADPRRQTVERAQGLRLVGRRRQASGPATTCPTSSRPSPRTTGRPRARRAATRCTATTRSSCSPTARAWLFAPSGPRRRPAADALRAARVAGRNPLYGQQANPARRIYEPPGQPVATRRRRSRSDVFPYVFTTYRLTEHHTAGGMSRTLPVPVGAAAGDVRARCRRSWPPSAGLEHLGWATSITARTAIEARVLVTDRMAPLKMGGRIVHQVGMPYHWGQHRADHR